MIKRKCLKCGKYFGSEGPHNRLCEMCNRENKKISTRLKKFFYYGPTIKGI